MCGNLVLKQLYLLWLLLSICFRRGNVNFLKAILTKQTNLQTNLQTNKHFVHERPYISENQSSHTRTKRIITSFARDYVAVMAIMKMKIIVAQCCRVSDESSSFSIFTRFDNI